MYINKGRGRGSRPSSQSLQNNSFHSQHTSNSFENINLMTIQLELDEESQTWFLEFKNMWTYWKNSPPVVNMLIKRFEYSRNPYEEALRLVYNCVDFKYAKPKSLSYLIMSEFQTWTNIIGSKVKQCLTREVKISAFNVVRQQTLFTFMKLIAEIYEMDSESDIFLDIIKYMIQQQQYKEACQSVALLGLHKNFGVREFLIPLILQDKIVVVEEFLADSPSHQLEIVKFLDSLLGRSTSIKQEMERLAYELNIHEIKWQKFHYKPYRKLISRLKKMYKLSDDITPMLIQKQNEGALQFLLNRRYAENNIGAESFKEMVHEAVQNDKKLQLEVVREISDQYGDCQTALELATHYNISQIHWPLVLMNFYEQNQNANNSNTSSSSSTSSEKPMSTSREINATSEYYKLKIPFENIFLIENELGFRHFFDNGLKDVDIVGIDCEWKPTFGSQNNELALIQIATRTNVYIFDIIKIIRLNDSSLWKDLERLCFSNPDIIKLGFGLISDINMIKQSIPHLNLGHKEGFLDLLQIWKKMIYVKFPYEVHGAGPGLSTLVHQCLGSPLNKDDQFSNWEKRPLRQSQLEYAALDAFCLIEVYDIMRECSEKANFPFDEMCANIISSSNKSSKFSKRNFHKKKREVIVPQPSNSHLLEQNAENVKFVCDAMLGGLGKTLRKCGIDTFILDNGDNSMKCVNLFQDEERFILTKGTAFNRLNGSVPAGCCLRILSNDVQEQLKEVLSYYKVTINEANVFSRCQICNSNNFIKVSNKEMKELVKAFRLISSTPAPAPASFYEDDHCNNFSDDDDDDDDDDDYDEQPTMPKNRTWDLKYGGINMQTCTTKFYAKVQVDSIPRHIINRVELFYICEECGKVYWDGTHFERFMSGKLSDIIQ